MSDRAPLFVAADGSTHDSSSVDGQKDTIHSSSRGHLALPLPDDEAPFGVVRVDSRYGEAGSEIAGSTASIQSGRTPVIRYDFPGGQNALGTPLLMCMFCLF